MQRRDFITWAGTVTVGAVVNEAAAQPAPVRHRIKIGQIGTAHGHARGKMETMRAHGDLFEVVGIVEPDAGLRAVAEANKSYAGLQWMGEAELFAAPGLEAVAIETGVRDLVPTARRAVDAGLHVHLDKPAGASLPEFRDLLDAAKKKGVVVQLGYMLRYNPAFQLMFRAVEEGWIGEIMEMDAMMGKMASSPMRDQLGEFAGGGMFELGGHLIDSMVHLLGEPEQVTPFLKRTKPERDEFADNCLAVLEWPKATATVRVNLRDPFGFPRRRFQIAGDTGALEIMQLESGNMTLSLSEEKGDYPKGTQEVELKRTGGRYDEEFKDLAQAIRGEKKLAWTANHDLAAHETLLRASGMSVD